MKKLVTTLHRWLGFPLGLFFVVTFGTGMITAVDEILSRIGNTDSSIVYKYRATTIDEDAQAIASITDGVSDIRSVIMPSPAAPYYQVVKRNQRTLYSIGDLTPTLIAKDNDEGFFRTVLQLHRNFLLGKEGLWGVEGKIYVTWVGLIALLISAIGLWVWWPLRKSFTIKDTLPRGTKRKHFYFNHMTAGVITLPLIVMLSLTGASIPYRDITKDLLGVEDTKPEPSTHVALANHWQAWLSAAQAAMPEAKLTQIRFPRKGKKRPPEAVKGQATAGQQADAAKREGLLGRNAKKNSNNDTGAPNRGAKTPQILEFKFLTQDDWLGLPNSTVSIDKNQSTLVGTSAFAKRGLGEKVYSTLVPLHTGHNLPTAYVVALLGFSLAGTVMVISGTVSFVRKKRRKLQWAKLSPWKRSSNA